MEGYLATISFFAGSFVPKGWMSCDGRLLQIAQYTALFSLLGTQYGGDGRTTFALPHLQEMTGAVPAMHGVQVIICVEGMFPERE
jgi:microcystin-dependent protein